MKYSVAITVWVACLLVVGSLALPLPQDVDVLELENNNDGSGNYNYKYVLSDGTKVDETGELKELQGPDGPVKAVVMTGSYEFVDAEGNVHRVTYIADEEGFHPVVES